MKIISLTIKNLASIQGEYVVNFDEGELGASGLFCITGATGSGKSTILDAISLALYAKTPRYQSSISTPMALDKIDPKDPRNLLHRGEKECLSEVEFVGVDGLRYKSSWSCKLSKRNVYASPSCCLMPMDGIFEVHEFKAHKFEEEATKEKIGLSYDQFARTVLLAQNQFASFLRAKESDKSALLEKLTGTEVYSLISIEIFNRKRDAEKDLDDLKNKLDAYQLLSDEELRGCIERHTELSNEKLRLQQELKVSTDRKENRISLQESHQELNEKLLSVRQEQERLAAEKLLAQKSYDSALQLKKDFDEEMNGMKPVIDSARTLDERLNGSAAYLKTCETDYDAAVLSVKTQQEMIRQKEEVREQNKEIIESCETYLRKTAVYQSMLEHYDTLYVKLEQAAGAFKEKNNSYGLLGSDEKEITEVNGKREFKLREQARIKTDAESVGKEMEQLREQIKGVGINGLQNAYSEMSKQKTTLQSDRNTWRDWCGYLEEQQKKQRLLKNEAEKAERLSLQIGALKAKGEETERAYQNQEYEVNRVMLYGNQSVEELRTALKEGDPCPVCGAVSHPFALQLQQDLKLMAEKLLDENKRELKRLDLARRGAAEAVNNWKMETAITDRQQKMLAGDLEELASHIANCAAQYTNVLKSYPKPELYSSAGQQDVLHQMDEALKQLDDEILSIGDRIKKYNAVSALIASKQGEMNSLQQQKERIDGEVSVLQDSYTTAVTNRGAHQRDFKQKETAYGNWVSALNGQLSVGDWQQRLERSSTGFLHDLETLHLAWQAKIELGKQKVQEQESLAGTIVLLKGHLDKLLLSESEAKKKLDERQREYGATKEERLGLLGGKSVTVVEDELLKKRKETDKLLDDAKAKMDGIAQQSDQYAGQITVYSQQYEKVKGDLDKHIADYAALEEIQKGIDKWQDLLTDLEPELEKLNSQLYTQKQNEQRIALFKPKLDRKRATSDAWNELSANFGQATGDRFKNIAQQYTMGILLMYANKQLELLTNRYELRQVHDSLTLDIIDHEMADTERTVNSLSGGETFLVSLGLALGLSSLASGKIRIESLFIDEGFGSLDADTLRITLDALEQLQAQGRKVGVISHVEELKERISAQIQVVKKSNGNSKVIVRCV